VREHAFGGPDVVSLPTLKNGPSSRAAQCPAIPTDKRVYICIQSRSFRATSREGRHRVRAQATLRFAKRKYYCGTTPKDDDDHDDYDDDDDDDSNDDYDYDYDYDDSHVRP